MVWKPSDAVQRQASQTQLSKPPQLPEKEKRKSAALARDQGHARGTRLLCHARRVHSLVHARVHWLADVDPMALSTPAQTPLASMNAHPSTEEFKGELSGRGAGRPSP